jgi:hypothetical protein
LRWVNPQVAAIKCLSCRKADTHGSLAEARDIAPHKCVPTLNAANFAPPETHDAETGLD